jgi:DNA-binding transcriptional regulator YhcF (GntR family)
MKLRTVLVRELADAALNGRRHWASLTELATTTGISIGLTHRVVDELEDVGVIRRSFTGGFDLTSPEKAVTIVATSRNIAREAVTYISRHSAAHLADSGAGPLAIGGMDAAVHHLGGNTVAAMGNPRILYLPRSVADTLQCDGDDVAVLPLDELAARTWARVPGYTSWTQTYGDLFGMAGWQAEEFRRAMFKSAFMIDDWETASA